MRKLTVRLSSSCVSIRNKLYINFHLAETIHFINLNIAKKKTSLEKLFWLSNAVLKHQKLIQTEKSMLCNAKT